jgi:hypothetical protein
MKLSPSIIMTRAISAKIKGTYNPVVISDGAKLILELDGTIRPLVVRRTGMGEDYSPTYELVSGEFVYLCALEARRIDPIRGETIDAYIMTEQNESVMMRQLMMF